MPRRELLVEVLLFALAGLFAVLGYDLFDRTAPYEPPPRPEPGLRLVTWNLGGSAGRSGRAFDDEHLEAVAETLDALRADLVFLQELEDSEQLERLRHALEGPLPAVAIAASGGRRVAVLARSGLLRGAWADGSRLLGARYWKPELAQLRFIALHADAWSAAERNQRIGSAVEQLFGGGKTSSGFRQSTEEDATDTYILAGDFNLDLDLDKRRDLFTGDEHLDVETYNWVAGRLEDAGLGSGPTAEPDRRLDYVFWRSETLELARAGVWQDRRVGDMDHDPLVVDLVPAH